MKVHICAVLTYKCVIWAINVQIYSESIMCVNKTLFKLKKVIRTKRMTLYKYYQNYT